MISGNQSFEIEPVSGPAEVNRQQIRMSGNFHADIRAASVHFNSADQKTQPAVAPKLSRE
jgi:hypothetical protein